jgi:RNA polymerase sigma factor (sigma-70 family)
VALFRAGHDEAFRVIHDRYRQRLFAYTRQMLPGSRQDAEDALQDVFVRAYEGLRSNGRELALRAWLYRVAHNRCVDELRRPPPPAPELLEFVRSPIRDPIAEAEQRESLRRLIADLRRLPEQQRSALLMRELSGMTYLELAAALGVSIPAVKSLLVRARVGLAQALEARETACLEIHHELVLAHDRGVRPNATARRHMRDCVPCREFHGEIRGMSKQFAALIPALGPFGVLANLLGFGSASGGAAAGGSAAVASGAAGTGGAFAAGGVLATGAGHVATLLAAAVVTAGGAVEIQGTISAPVKHHIHHRANPAAAVKNESSVVAPASVSAAAISAADPAAVAPAAPAPEPTAVPKKPRAATGPHKPPPISAASQNGNGSTTSSPSTTGGSPAEAGTGTGGSGTAASTGTTTAPPADGTQAPGATAATSGPQSATTGDPADGSSTSQLGGSTTSTQPGASGPQSGSSSGTSVTVSTTLGSDSGSSGTGSGTGSPGPSH